MGSLTAMSQGSGERYFQSTRRSWPAPSIGTEGVVAARARQPEPPRQVCSRRHRRPRPLSRTARVDGLPARRRPALRHGLPRLRHHRRAAEEGAASSASPAPACARATSTTSSSPAKRPTTTWNSRPRSGFWYWVCVWLPGRHRHRRHHGRVNRGVRLRPHQRPAPRASSKLSSAPFPTPAGKSSTTTSANPATSLATDSSASPGCAPGGSR